VVRGEQGSRVPWTLFGTGQTVQVPKRGTGLIGSGSPKIPETGT